MPPSPPDHPVPASWARVPRIRALSALQSGYVLSRNHVGRLAFVGNGRLELLPVHYVYADGLIIGRTSFGDKCSQWQDAELDVVFEVDEPDALFEWRSVIVRGGLLMLTALSTGEHRHAYWEAVTALRSLVPAAFTERDPTPTRRVVFTITPTEITGREASTSFLTRADQSVTGSDHDDFL